MAPVIWVVLFRFANRPLKVLFVSEFCFDHPLSCRTLDMSRARTGSNGFSLGPGRGQAQPGEGHSPGSSPDSADSGDFDSSPGSPRSMESGDAGPGTHPGDETHSGDRTTGTEVRGHEALVQGTTAESSRFRTAKQDWEESHQIETLTAVKGDGHSTRHKPHKHTIRKPFLSGTAWEEGRKVSRKQSSDQTGRKKKILGWKDKSRAFSAPLPSIPAFDF